VTAPLAERMRRSLRAKLLVPALAVGAAAAVVTATALYGEFKRHSQAEMSRWARSLANSVNYAAETSDEPADLERFVTALGAEPAIRIIVVAAGEPPQVLAATRMAWWNHPLGELPHAGIRRQLRQTIREGARTRWSDDGQRLLAAVPLRVHRPNMDPGRLAAGAVYVELDARAELAHQRLLALLAGGSVGAAILAMTALGLWLVQSRVLRPIGRIQEAVECRRRGDREAYAPVSSGDEMGQLAAATNRLLDAQEEREALFRQMFSAHPAVQLLLDARNGTIVDLNQAAEAFYGYPRDALIGDPISRLNTLAPEELQEVVDRIRGRGRLQGQFHHRLADGEVREVAVETGVVEVAGQAYLHSIIHDVTEENRYRRQLETYGHLFRNLPVGMFRSSTGSEGRFLELNPAMAELFGAADTDELARHTLVSLYRDAADHDTVLADLHAHGQIRRREVAMQRLDGEAMWCSLTAYLLTDDYGTQFVDGIVEDITERKALEAELQHQATHDLLTGAYNRLRFEELLEQEAERAHRYGTPFALIMLDIDRFKGVNDTYGHDAGDAILRDLVQFVGSRLRGPDTLARWGGEEFMVLLPETGRQGAEDLAEQLRAAVAGHAFPGAGPITISAGVAEYHADRPLKALLKAVDDALYRAKERGRNRVEARGDD